MIATSYLLGQQHHSTCITTLNFFPAQNNRVSRTFQRHTLTSQRNKLTIYTEKDIPKSLRVVLAKNKVGAKNGENKMAAK